MRETEDHKENYSEFMEILKNSSKMELISEKGAYL